MSSLTAITLRTAASQLGAALGDSAAAHLAAQALLEADILGMPRFGLDMLNEYEAPELPTAIETAPLAQPLQTFDCATYYSPVAIAAATLALSARAKHHGFAATFLTNIRGFGRLAPFVRRLADAGLVAMAGTEGGPVVAPVGGTRPVINTNPFAFAMGQGDDQVVIDIATSALTLAELREARARNALLPPHVALDAHGQPTRSAEAAVALLPRDGRIGSLLGLVIELLAGVVSGGRHGTAGRGFFMLALDPAAVNPDTWEAKLAELRQDWLQAGGHWPKGRPLAEDSPLSAEVAQRLRDRLATIVPQSSIP